MPVIIRSLLLFASQDINGFGPHETKLPLDLKAIPNSEKYFAPVPAPATTAKFVGVVAGATGGTCIVKALSNSTIIKFFTL